MKQQVKNKKKPPLTTIRNFIRDKAGFTFKKARARHNNAYKIEKIEERFSAAKVYLQL